MIPLRRAYVDFSRTCQDWDGFGFNYVETCQTRDYAAEPQDYGGFSIQKEEDRQAIVELTFGEDGLQPAILKMFLDPFHQKEPAAGYRLNDPLMDMTAYDHVTTTRWMRFFAREGARRARERGEDFPVLVTLYGPPGWMTLQRFVRGRDLDPRLKMELGKYLLSWARYLREAEGLNVRFASLHNEGEDWQRWPLDGSAAGEAGHDYNLYWPPEQVTEYLRFLPAVARANGIPEVGIACGETSNWRRFDDWGYANALAADAEALQNLALITSHGFYSPGQGRWNGDWRSAGIDKLRAARPELRAWVTSTSWSKMDVLFVDEARNSIYSAKVNAIIPWAGIQRSKLWTGGDPNPGTAFRVHEDGTFSVEPGYYYYKQLTRAGRRGMKVAEAACNDSERGIIAFASAGTAHPDAFLVLNWSQEAPEPPLEVEVRGRRVRAFQAFRTSPREQYAPAGVWPVLKGRVACEAPPLSVTTFFAMA